jgi:hypothetical protein
VERLQPDDVRFDRAGLDKTAAVEVWMGALALTKASAPELKFSSKEKLFG